jgi:hypothetical protein
LLISTSAPCLKCLSLFLQPAAFIRRVLHFHYFQAHPYTLILYVPAIFLCSFYSLFFKTQVSST